MTLFYLFLVALIQGVTEFLPVSSSGHLILLPQLTGAQDQGLLIDVAVHVGTLFAVILYFRSDVSKAIRGLPRLIVGKADTDGAKLSLLLIVSTIPVVAAGLALKLSGLSDQLRSIEVIGWTMLIFGLVLYWADRFHDAERPAEDWTFRHAVILGLWQMLALIPGTSRSGITITGARRLGYDRQSAARIAMLMSIPTIAASGALLGADLIANRDWAMILPAAIAALLAFAAAIAALAIMMRLLKTISYTPYVVYRVILGLVLLYIAYS